MILEKNFDNDDHHLSILEDLQSLEYFIFLGGIVFF